MEEYSQAQVQKEYRIIIVSSGEENIKKELNALTDCGYKVICINSLARAIEIISKEHVDLLLVNSSAYSNLDSNIIEQMRDINKDLYTLLLIEKNSSVPSIRTMKRLNIQGYCEKSDDCSQLLLLVESGIQSIFQKREIKKINSELSDTRKQLVRNYLESIETLRHTVDARDPYTRGHSDRVAEYAVLIGKKMGLDEQDLRKLHTGGLFHDIGKIGIPDNILFKNTRLSNEEYSKIKDHASIGSQILSSATIFNDIIPIVKYHHERFDGTGYPENLVGEEIPLMARIISVADTFDAMYSKRAYRDKMEMDIIVKEISKNKGTQFDPKIADVFLNIIRNDFDDIRKIEEKF